MCTPSGPCVACVWLCVPGQHLKILFVPYGLKVEKDGVGYLVSSAFLSPSRKGLLALVPTAKALATLYGSMTKSVTLKQKQLLAWSHSSVRHLDHSRHEEII